MTGKYWVAETRNSETEEKDGTEDWFSKEIKSETEDKDGTDDQNQFSWKEEAFNQKRNK